MSLLRELPQILEDAKKEYEECPAEDYFPVERYGEGEPENIFAQGECLSFMKYLLEEKDMAGKISVIYVDPPFFTKMKHSAVINSPEDELVKAHAYSDSWRPEDYYRMLAARLYAMKDLLREDGCIWVHLDWHAAHYTKILLDEIFGENNFINEVIWTYKSGGSSKKHFARKHDNLLFYSKSKKYYFEPQKEKSYNRGFKPYRFKGVEEFEDEKGWYTMVNMKDVWNIDMVGRTSSERTGYATQKPEALIARIIESCSRPGDICADFFAGSGTCASAALGMGRSFISCDSGDLACEMAIRRLEGKNISFDFYKNVEIIEENSIDISVSNDIINVGAYQKSDRFIDMWSIDPDYDGKIHKPKSVFKRSKKEIETELKLEKEQISLFDSPESKVRLGEYVSIVIYDVTGSRKHYVVGAEK